LEYRMEYRTAKRNDSFSYAEKAKPLIISIARNEKRCLKACLNSERGYKKEG